MRNEVFTTQICSIARTLEVVGEWWTLLIVREAVMGTRRFSDFAKRLGIAKNVLSERLNKLVETGILDRTEVRGRGNPRDYTLTERGRDLLPLLIALMQWGDRWVQGQEHVPVRVLERTSGKEIARLQVSGPTGAPLAVEDIVIVPGPGAGEAIRRRFQPEPE